MRWWEETHRAFLDQGEWTVTVCAGGTDHTAVREAFAAGLPGRRDEILADTQNRIPRRSGKTVKTNPDTPEKVRRDWQRARHNGTAPKPAKAAFAPGGWVTWTHPGTGETLTGVVTGWLPEHHSGEFPRHARTIVPADGSEPLVMQLQPKAKPSEGPWLVVYGIGQSSTVQPDSAPS
ncbi:hypothetical protein ACH4PU_35980 [Streptomyces sp. NPDC021100]|uniref:hypothetical protein n=1 Tax=Streptomyces sp. NPDC021100 TaxID=3365114 RepID=UPI0037A4461A